MFSHRVKLFTLFGFQVRVDASWLLLGVLISWTLAVGVFPAALPGLGAPTYWWMAIGLVERFARCFSDRRAAAQVEHTVTTMVGQRVFGIALGYEDLLDHDELRYDPIMAVLAGKLAARRRNCAPVAGKSTLNPLELGADESTAYHKIGYDPRAIEAAFVNLFLDAHQHPPPQIILDLDATDDPLHGHQEGRFFHGY